MPTLPFGDYGDLATILMAAVLSLGYFVKKSTKTESYSVTEVIDDGVLGKFAELFKRIGRLENDLHDMTDELNSLVVQLHTKEGEMEQYRLAATAALAQKDKEIKSLRTSLENHRRRIKELENQQEEST